MRGSADSRDPGRWIAALGLVVAGVVFCYPLALDIPLLDPDEGLHASIAQEMVEGGDWRTPRFLGEPFLDKPPLYFWVQAASLRLFGMDEAAVRFPGLMFGLFGAVTTAGVGWRMIGRRTGLLAGVFYATMILPAALAQAPVHDVVLVPCVNMALLLFWEADRAARWQGRWACVLGAGLVLGLACLAKGLAGVALVGVAYGGYLVLSGKLSRAACIRGGAALAVAASVASAWYIPAELHNPGYLAYYFGQRHLLGYATASQRHGGEPWWYYLPVLLGGGLPWIAYLPAMVQDGWHRWRGQPAGLVVTAFMRSRPAPMNRGTTSGGTLLWCWLVGCTLFLSASHSKLITYVWPVFPPVAILAAAAWVRLLEGTLARPARRTMLLTFWLSSLGGVALPPAVMLVAQGKFNARFGWPVWVVTMLVAFGAWTALGLLWTGRLRAALAGGLLSIAAQYVAVVTLAVPPVAATTSARELAGHFNRVGRLPPRVLLVEDRLGSLVFYLQRRLRARLESGQLEVVRLEREPRLPAAEPGSVVVLPERELDRARRWFDPDGVPYRRVGRYRLYRADGLGSADLAGGPPVR